MTRWTFSLWQDEYLCFLAQPPKVRKGKLAKYERQSVSNKIISDIPASKLHNNNINFVHVY